MQAQHEALGAHLHDGLRRAEEPAEGCFDSRSGQTAVFLLG